VLALVVAHRHDVGVVQEDVGGLQRRVGEQAGGHEPAGALALGLVLELGHPRQLAEAGVALHQPGQAGVLGHVALHEQRARLGVEAGGDEQGGDRQRALAQLGGVLGHGEGVQVDHAEHGIGVVLVLDPAAHGAQVVAQVHVAGGLDAGEGADHGRAS
jgi:hypothetical protein